MGEEINETVEVERMRLESFALASHPSTNTDYLNSLFALRRKEEEEKVEPEEQEWITPESAGDIENFLKTFN